MSLDKISTKVERQSSSGPSWELETSSNEGFIPGAHPSTPAGVVWPFPQSITATRGTRSIFSQMAHYIPFTPSVRIGRALQEERASIQIGYSS